MISNDSNEIFHGSTLSAALLCFSFLKSNLRKLEFHKLHVKIEKQEITTRSRVNEAFLAKSLILKWEKKLESTESFPGIFHNFKSIV